MRAAVPDWEVEPQCWLPLAQGLRLPDPGDVHVLAAAIAGHCDCIVTTNLDDFPRETLAAHSIDPVHPDDFLVFQIDLDEHRCLAAFKAMRARLRNPAMTPAAFADTLARSGLVATAQRLRLAGESL